MLQIIQSALSSDDLKRLLTQVKADDAIVLMADGVYLANQLSSSPCPCFHLGSDSHLRGVTVPNTIQSIDMAGLVGLTEQHASSASW